MSAKGQKQTLFLEKILSGESPGAPKNTLLNFSQIFSMEKMRSWTDRSVTQTRNGTAPRYPSPLLDMGPIFTRIQFS